MRSVETSILQYADFTITVLMSESLQGKACVIITQ